MKQRILNYIRTTLTNKLRRAGYSNVAVEATIESGKRYPDLIVQVTANKNGEKTACTMSHPTMSMWSAQDAADCFFGLIIKDPFIVKEYSDKLVKTR